MFVSNIPSVTEGPLRISTHGHPAPPTATQLPPTRAPHDGLDHGEGKFGLVEGAARVRAEDHQRLHRAGRGGAVRDFGEWDKLPEDIVCAIPFYERLAHFLLNVYTIPTGVGNMGESLSGDTPKNYLGIAINQAADKWKAVGQDATKRFFSCQDEKSTSDQRRESGCRGSH